jgi:hypothetical protein
MPRQRDEHIGDDNDDEDDDNDEDEEETEQQNQPVVIPAGEEEPRRPGLSLVVDVAGEWPIDRLAKGMECNSTALVSMDN